MSKYEYLLKASGQSVQQREFKIEMLDVSGHRNSRGRWIQYCNGCVLLYIVFVCFCLFLVAYWFVCIDDDFSIKYTV